MLYENRAFLVLSFYFIFSFFSTLSVSDTKPRKLIGLFQVFDAGTITSNGVIYKIKDITTPTARQKCKRGALPWLCGAAAKKFLATLIGNKILKCAVIELNQVQCFLEGRDLSILLIKNGWAVSLNNNKKALDAEKTARKKELGLWKKAN
jgi:endonuclease YncB( thermonuclease family)